MVSFGYGIGPPVMDSLSLPWRPDTVPVLALNVYVPTKIESLGWVSGSRNVATTS